MKQKMKTIFKVFALILLITFSSCNEDLYESQTQQSESKFQIKELSKSEIELNLKLSQELNQIQNFKSKIVASKMVYDPVYDFFVNTDEALYISDGVSESYTFPVYRATSNSTLENLVIHIQNEQTLVYLVDYGYSYSEIRSMDKQELEQIDLKHYLIDFDSDILNNRVAMAQYVCIETIALNPLYGNCTETHSNGETCNQQQFIVQSSFCQWVYDDSGNGGDGSTGGTGEPLDYSGGAGNTGNISSSTSTINTIPMGCSTCPEFSLELEEFLGTLDADQLAIWNDLLPKTQQDIIKYLKQNSYSSESVAFVKEALVAFNEGGEIDIYNNIIYLINKPCQNQIIKDILNTTSPLTNLINQTFNTNNKVNVKFTNVDIPDNDGDGFPDGNAYTNPFYYGTSSNFTINISFDNTFLESSTNLGIVATTLHELIHAQLIQLYIKGELISTNTEYNNLLNAFMAFYENAHEDTFTTLDNEIHNAMLDFIEKIGNSIYNYAVSKGINVTQSYCVNLA